MKTIDNSENIHLEITRQLKEINSKINLLQDLFYEMKNELSLIKRSKIQENYFSNMTKIADDNLNKFLDNRPMDCNILDFCTTLVEKGVFRVLRILMEKGEEAAIIQIEKYLKLSESPQTLKTCPNNKCLENSIDIFKLLKDLITDSKELSSKYFKELTLLEEELEIEETNEEQINEILTPLSNVIRLKILKNLKKGGKYYSQLEEEIGIKAGHLLFHIEKLKEANYVIQENKKYIITLNGRKVLNLISGLRKELSFNS